MADMPRMDMDSDGLLLWIRAVPGGSRDQIAGLIGDRLKIKVAAPPEQGKANDAICRVLAQALKLKPRAVTIESGQTNPEKIVRIRCDDPDAIMAMLATLSAR